MRIIKLLVLLVSSRLFIELFSREYFDWLLQRKKTSQSINTRCVVLLCCRDILTFARFYWRIITIRSKDKQVSWRFNKHDESILKISLTLIELIEMMQSYLRRHALRTFNGISSVDIQSTTEMKILNRFSFIRSISNWRNPHVDNWYLFPTQGQCIFSTIVRVFDFIIAHINFIDAIIFHQFFIDFHMKYAHVSWSKLSRLKTDWLDSINMKNTYSIKRIIFILINLHWN